MARRKPNRDLVVQAKDCYDPADYILVHNKFFDGMRDAIRAAHRGNISECSCVYCRVEAASLSDSASREPT